MLDSGSPLRGVRNDGISFFVFFVVQSLSLTFFRK